MVVRIYPESGIDWNAKGKDRIIQNVANLLKTRMFEVPFLRYMGIDSSILDRTPQEIEIDLKINVKEMIETYEPRATFINLNIESIDENGNPHYYVEIEV